MAISRFIAATGYDGDRLTIYDVTDPGTPVQVGTITDAGLNTAWGLQRIGNAILVNRDVNNSIAQVDITNKASMVIDDDLSNTHYSEGRIAALHPNGTDAIFLFFPDNYLGIFRANLAANDVTIVGAYDGNVSGGLDAPAGIAISATGAFAYVGCFDDGLIEVIDISNPAAPARVGTGFAVTGIVAGSGPTAIARKGTYLYVADVNADVLYVVNVTDEDGPLAAPVDTLAHASLDGIRSLQVHPTLDYLYAYCSTTQSLLTIDIADPADISVVDVEAVPVVLLGVASMSLAISPDGAYLYMATGDTDSVQIASLADPAAPAFVGSCVDATDLDDCRAVVAWTEGVAEAIVASGGGTAMALALGLGI